MKRILAPALVLFLTSATVIQCHAAVKLFEDQPTPQKFSVAKTQVDQFLKNMKSIQESYQKEIDAINTDQTPYKFYNGMRDFNLKIEKPKLVGLKAAIDNLQHVSDTYDPGTAYWQSFRFQWLAFWRTSFQASPEQEKRALDGYIKPITDALTALKSPIVKTKVNFKLFGPPGTLPQENALSCDVLSCDDPLYGSPLMSGQELWGSLINFSTNFIPENYYITSLNESFPGGIPISSEELGSAGVITPHMVELSVSHFP